MNGKRRWLAWVTLGPALVVAAPEAGRAAATFHPHRAAWTAALPSGAPFSEDFSSFAADAPFHTVPVAIGGGAISREGPEPGLSNYVDVLPLTFPGGSGTNQAEVFVNTLEGMNVGTNVRITFAQPNLAFGFDVWEAVGLEGARLEIYNGAALLGSQVLPGGNGAFVGYTLTGGETATSVLFRANSLIVGTSGEGFAIDNLAGIAVPEPTAGALLLVGTAILRGRARHKPRA